MVSPRYASHVLGTGPIIIEVWLDYICPYSKKQFDKIYGEISGAAQKQFPGRFQWVFQHQLQPWHAQGSWLHEAAIAVGLIEPKLFWKFSHQLFAQSAEFYDEAVLDKGRTKILQEVASIAADVGVDKQKFLSALEIDTDGSPRNRGSAIINDVKAYVKLGRQTGIHVSPTVLINGIVDPEISSSWGTEQWLDKLAATIKAVDAKI